ncbi:hypothetical protein HMI54_007385 [Coelomomyces lativittatus]|nr:hypothetical protein HMI54_007385 [Coelomomyces lativittatus]
MKIEVVRHAKVPIVKAVHYALGISVDISVNQVIGMTTVDTVKVWSERHPALRPLTLVLKMFFFCRELNEVFTGGISSYTLITMVYVFLDMHPLLRSHEINEQENLGVLLIEWFELFGRCFDPKLTMVTVHGFRNKSTEFIQKLRLNPNFLSILDPLNKGIIKHTLKNKKDRERQIHRLLKKEKECSFIHASLTLSMYQDASFFLFYFYDFHHLPFIYFFFYSIHRSIDPSLSLPTL